jgi:succinate dehydrogenase / fumarate reductase membrane anchor subunit
LKAWVLQRITAVYIGLFVLVLLGHLLAGPPADYQAWRAWVARPWVSIGLLLFTVALLLHAWIGIRDVLIDYVKPLVLRLSLLSLFGIAFVASGLWAAKAVFLAHGVG